MTVNELAEKVKAFREGDKEAFDRIYELTEHDLFVYALYLTGDIEKTKDILQETYMITVNRIWDLKDEGKFIPWAKTIMFHEALHRYNLDKKAPLLVDENEISILTDIEETENAFLPEEAVEDMEMRDIIVEAVRELPPEQSFTIIAYYYDQMTITEIAKMMHTKEGTVKTRLFYGRAALRKIIDAYEKKCGKIRGADRENGEE